MQKKEKIVPMTFVKYDNILYLIIFNYVFYLLFSIYIMHNTCVK